MWQPPGAASVIRVRAGPSAAAGERPSRRVSSRLLQRRSAKSEQASLTGSTGVVFRYNRRDEVVLGRTGIVTVTKCYGQARYCVSLCDLGERTAMRHRSRILLQDEIELSQFW
jgi:hypothetical protein